MQERSHESASQRAIIREPASVKPTRPSRPSLWWHIALVPRARLSPSEHLPSLTTKLRPKRRQLRRQVRRQRDSALNLSLDLNLHRLLHREALAKSLMALHQKTLNSSLD